MFSHQKWLQVFKTLKRKGLDLTWITFRWHDLRLQFESLGGRQESSFFLGVSIRTLRRAVQHPTCREINDSLITTKLTFSIPNEQNPVGILNSTYALRGCCKKGEHHPWRHRDSQSGRDEDITGKIGIRSSPPSRQTNPRSPRKNKWLQPAPCGFCHTILVFGQWRHLDVILLPSPPSKAHNDKWLLIQSALLSFRCCAVQTNTYFKRKLRC